MRGLKRRVPKRTVVLGILLVVMALAGVGGAIAWLTASGNVENQFTVGNVDPVIDEDFNDPHYEKKNVTVKNNGNVPIYVRARVDIYWEAADGSVMWEKPEVDTDYTQAGGLPADNGWVKFGDFYYWTNPLPPLSEGGTGSVTGRLINSIKQDDEQQKRYPDGRKLVVDVSIQGIQAEPTDAVIDAWGVEIDGNGTITGLSVAQGESTGTNESSIDPGTITTEGEA